MPPALAEISRTPGVRGGRPTIAGTGISVRAIAVDSNLGESPEEIAANRPHLSLAQVHAALAYYCANKQVALHALAFPSPPVLAIQ